MFDKFGEFDSFSEINELAEKAARLTGSMASRMIGTGRRIVMR